jgi:citrate synthase
MPKSAILKGNSVFLIILADGPRLACGKNAALQRKSWPGGSGGFVRRNIFRNTELRFAFSFRALDDLYWDATFEDSLSLIAKLPEVVAGIYRMRYGKGKRIAPNAGLTWAENYAHMLGIPDPDGTFKECMRLYLLLHCDHDSGNVSAHTTHLVFSALSDIYYSVAAGLNGLAGPLHGLANQECLKFIIDMKERFGGVPTDEQMRQFVWGLLKSGKVVPGYGHAVLRVTDPRFIAFRAFGEKHMSEDPIFKIVNMLFGIVPGILKEYSDERVRQGKKPVANFWPNVDAGSGALLCHYGLTEFDYYTVLFAVSRALGMCAQAIYSRAMGEQIERPTSLSMESLEEAVERSKA